MERVFAGTKVHFLTHDRASWVLHVPRWYRSVFDAIGVRALLLAEHDDGVAGLDGDVYAHWFERVWELHPPQPGTIKMYGRDVLTPRFQQAYDMTIRFSGSTFEAKPLPALLQQSVKTMQAMLMNPETSRSFLRGALLNWYANGEQYIGPHDDADKRFLPNSPVFSLSLGATRKFVFSAKQGTKRKRAAEREVEEEVDDQRQEKAGADRANDDSRRVVERLELLLQDGDLVIMGGTTQLTHKHAVPKMKRCLEKRVSVTLRCFRD